MIILLKNCTLSSPALLTNVPKDNLYGPSGICSGTARGFVQVIHGNRSKRANLVPADWVVNAMISCAWDINRRYQSSPTISIILMSNQFGIEFYVGSKSALKIVYKFLFITIFIMTTIWLGENIWSLFKMGLTSHWIEQFGTNIIRIWQFTNTKLIVISIFVKSTNPGNIHILSYVGDHYLMFSILHYTLFQRTYAI